tara:strand:- start:901 stop:1098 length:198 start_codon:yes stop_codon:yes gene_type:complete
MEYKELPITMTEYKNLLTIKNIAHSLIEFKEKDDTDFDFMIKDCFKRLKVALNENVVIETVLDCK